MTLSGVYRKKYFTRMSAVRKALYCYMVLFVCVLFFKNSAATAVWISDGLGLCASKLIPSLFPFMVLSSLLLSSTAGSGVLRLVSAPLRKLFGITESGASALVLGWVCGFPVGAKCACELYSDGKISQREYSLLVCMSGTPSPAFLIGSVGGSMLASRTSGTLLYICSLVSCVAVGLIFRFTDKSTVEPLAPPVQRSTPVSFSQSFAKAVSDAGIGMLNICAFVVFFSALIGVLDGILFPLGLSESTRGMIFCFFEITSGIARLSALPPDMALPLISLAVGWSGMSVHFQTLAICRDDFPLLKYLCAHALKAVLFLCLISVLS